MPKLCAEQVEVFPFRRRGAQVEFLMLRRAADRFLGGTWHAVHGSIEPGETAVQAAIREMREESGLPPLRFWQLDYVSVFFLAARDEIHHNAVFTAEVAPDADVVLSDEHDDHRWIPAETAAEQFLWPNQRHAIAEILAEVIAPGPAEAILRVGLGTE